MRGCSVQIEICCLGISGKLAWMSIGEALGTFDEILSGCCMMEEYTHVGL